jgi:hypothetical protein
MVTLWLTGTISHLTLTYIQVGVQFVQIGDHPEAAAFLQELDDCLQGNHAVRVSYVDETGDKSC